MPVPLPAGLEPGLSDEAFFEPTNNTYPFGCHISMLEIDRETGEPKLLKLVAVDDAGNLINPLIVEGQIHGGLAQGIGQAMIEEAVYNEDGQLLTGSFMDYAMPRAIDFPRFELHSTVTPTPVNPLGAKGVGEAGTLGSTPCIVAAAVDALSEFGVKHIDMMLRPEKLWRIIRHGRPGVIPTAFDYQRATSIDDALAKLAAADGGGKLLAGGHSLVPLMKLRLSEPAVADRHRADSRPVRHPREGRRDRDRRRDRRTTTWRLGAAPGTLPGARRDGGGDRRSAGAQPRHPRRQPRPRRSGSGLPGGDARARRRHARAEHARRAGRQGARLLPGSVHGRSRARRDHRRRPVRAVQAAAYAKLHQRASHFAIVGVAAALEVAGGRFNRPGSASPAPARTPCG